MLAAVSAVWFGVVSMLYPEHVGSLGAIGGAACVVWGIAIGCRKSVRTAVRSDSAIQL